jgi:hypothetical protein
MTLVSVLAVCALATGAFATTDHEFGWTISSSTTSPDVNYSPTPMGGPGTLYLWLKCSSEVTGAAASEWGFVLTGMLWGGIAGVSPYLFTGSESDMLGAYGNVNPETMVGIITVFDFSGGNICLGNSAANDRNITVGVDGKGYVNDWRGFASVDGAPCETSTELCSTEAVEAETWGNIKSLYR